MIELHNIVKTFRPFAPPKSWFHAPPIDRPLTVLQGIDLHVRPGEVVGIHGANGGGKSTLLRLIAGLIEPDAGTLRRPESVSLLDADRLQLEERLTIRENLTYLGALRGLGQSECHQRLKEHARLLNIDYLDRRVNGCSSGMRQGAYWLLALLPQSPVLLLDEPFISLDEAHIETAITHLRHWVDQDERGGVVVSHQRNCLERCSDRVLHLNQGRLS